VVPSTKTADPTPKYKQGWDEEKERTWEVAYDLSKKSLKNALESYFAGRENDAIDQLRAAFGPAPTRGKQAIATALAEILMQRGDNTAALGTLLASLGEEVPGSNLVLRGILLTCRQNSVSAENAQYAFEQATINFWELEDVADQLPQPKNSADVEFLAMLALAADRDFSDRTKSWHRYAALAHAARPNHPVANLIYGQSLSVRRLNAAARTCLERAVAGGKGSVRSRAAVLLGLVNKR